MTDCTPFAATARPAPANPWPRAGYPRLAVSRPPDIRNGELAPDADESQAGDCTEEIVGYIPALRFFARSLCRDPVEADDLVQETLVRAIENLRLFQRGTNLRAWLFTIMRNRFYSNWAKRARERTGEKDCVSSVPMATAEPQLWHLRAQELERALQQLPVHYRETIILVGALGESYLQAAAILDCDIGTIKSRVNRARAALREKLGGTAES